MTFAVHFLWIFYRTVTVDDRQVSVVDDGVWTDALRAGNGLTGLRERAAAAGARVVVSHPRPQGFSVQVIVEGTA